MKKLAQQSDKNSPREYDRIFVERAKKDPNWQDVRRWQFLIRYFKKGMLLDVGCLDSQIADLIKDYGTYVGMDLAEDAIRKMNDKYGWEKAEFFVGDLYETGTKSDIFNYVVLGETLEHLERPADAVKEAFRVLEPNGILAISVPLEEAIEPGACDKDRHLWSFIKEDIKNLVKPYSSKFKFKVLRSQYFPKYRYCWPQLICWATKTTNN